MEFKSYPDPHRGRPGQVGGSLPRAESAVLPDTLPTFGARRHTAAPPPPLKTANLPQPLRDLVEGIETVGDCDLEVVDYVARTLTVFPAWATANVKHVILRAKQGPARADGYHRTGEWDAQAHTVTLDDCARSLDGIFIVELADTLAHEVGHSLYERWERQAHGEFNRAVREGRDGWLEMIPQVGAAASFGLKREFMAEALKHPEYQSLRNWTIWQRAWASGEDGVTPYSSHMGSPWETAAELATFYLLHKRQYEPKFTGLAAVEAICARQNAIMLSVAFGRQMEWFAAQAAATKQLSHTYPTLSQDRFGINRGGKSYPAPHVGLPGHHGGSRPRGFAGPSDIAQRQALLTPAGERRIRAQGRAWQRDSVEHAALFDADGNIIVQGAGREKEIDIPGEWIDNTRAAVFLHTHPADATDWEAQDAAADVLSAPDINAISKMAAPEIWLVTPWRTIRVQRPPQGWPQTFSKDINFVYRSYLERPRELMPAKALGLDGISSQVRQYLFSHGALDQLVQKYGGSMWVEYHTELLYPRRGRNERVPSRVGMSPKAPRFPAQPIHQDIDNPKARWPRRADSQQHLFPLSAVKSYPNPGHRGRPGQVGGSLPRTTSVPGPESGRIRVRKPAGVRKLEDAVAAANSRGRIQFSAVGGWVKAENVTAAADAIYALPEWLTWGVKKMVLRGAAGRTFAVGGKSYQQGGDWSAWDAEIGLDGCDFSNIDAQDIQAKITHEAGHAFFDKWEDLAVSEMMALGREHPEWIDYQATHEVDGQNIGRTWLSEAGLAGIADRTDVPFLRALATWRTAWDEGEDGVTPYSEQWSKVNVDCETAAEMCKLYFRPAFGGGLTGEAALRGMSQSWRAPHLAEALLSAIDAMQSEIVKFKAGQKHYGPGTHPGTNTPQTIHGGGAAPYDPEWVYSEGTERFQPLVHKAISRVPGELRALVKRINVKADAESEARQGGLLAGHWDKDSATIDLYDVPGARSAEKAKDFAFHEVGHAAYDRLLHLAKTEAATGKIVERLTATWLDGGYAVTPYAYSWAKKLMAFREGTPDYLTLFDAAQGEAFAEVCSAYLRLGRPAAHKWLLKQRHTESNPLAMRAAYEGRRAYAEAAMDALDLLRRDLRSQLHSGAKHYGPGPHSGTGTEQDAHAGANVARRFVRTEKSVVGPNGNALVGYEHITKMEGVYSKREGGEVGKWVSDWDNAVPCTSCGRKLVHVYWVEDQAGAQKPFGSEHLHTALGMPREVPKKDADLWATRLAAEQRQREVEYEHAKEVHAARVADDVGQANANFYRYGGTGVKPEQTVLMQNVSTGKFVRVFSGSQARVALEAGFVPVRIGAEISARLRAELDRQAETKSYPNPGHRGRRGKRGGSLPREQGQSAYGSGGYGMRSEYAAWVRKENEKFYAQSVTRLDVALPNGGTLGSVGMVNEAWQTTVPRWLADVPPWAADLIQTVTLYGGAAPEADTMASMDRRNGRMAFMMCVQAPGVAWGGKDGYAENLLRHELSHAVAQEWLNRAYKEQQRAAREHPELFDGDSFADDDLVSFEDIIWERTDLRKSPDVKAQYPYLYYAMQAGRAFAEGEDGVNPYTREWHDKPIEIVAEFGKYYFRRNRRVDEAAVRKLCAPKDPRRTSWGYVDKTRVGAPIAAEAYIEAMRLLAADYAKEHADKSYPGPGHRGRPGQVGGSLPREQEGSRAETGAYSYATSWQQREMTQAFYHQPGEVLVKSLPGGGKLRGIGKLDPAWVTLVPKMLAGVPLWAAALVRNVKCFAERQPSDEDVPVGETGGTYAAFDMEDGRLEFYGCSLPPGARFGRTARFAEDNFRHEIAHAAIQAWLVKAGQEQWRYAQKHPGQGSTAFPREYPSHSLDEIEAPKSLTPYDYNDQKFRDAYPYYSLALRMKSGYRNGEGDVSAYARAYKAQPLEVLADIGIRYFRAGGKTDEDAVRKFCASKPGTKRKTGAPQMGETFIEAMRLLAADYAKEHATKSYPGPGHRGRPGMRGGSLPRVAGRPVATASLNPAAGGYQTLPYAPTGRVAKPKKQTFLTDAPGLGGRLTLEMEDTGDEIEMARWREFYSNDLFALAKTYPGLFQNVATVEIYATEEHFWSDGAEWVQDGEWQNAGKRIRLYLRSTSPADETLRHEAAHSLYDLWMERYNHDGDKMWAADDFGGTDAENAAKYPWWAAWKTFGDGVRAGEDGVSAYTRAAFEDGMDAGRPELFAWAFEDIMPAEFTPDGMRAHMQKFGLRKTADGVAEFLRLLQAETPQAAKSYPGPGHRGRPGKQGGSLPRAALPELMYRARAGQPLPDDIVRNPNGDWQQFLVNPQTGEVFVSTQPYMMHKYMGELLGMGENKTEEDFIHATRPTGKPHLYFATYNLIPPRLFNSAHMDAEASDRYAERRIKQAARVLRKAGYGPETPVRWVLASGGDLDGHLRDWSGEAGGTKSYPNPGHRGRVDKVGGSLPRASAGVPNQALRAGAQPAGDFIIPRNTNDAAAVANFTADGERIAEEVMRARFGPKWQREGDPLLISWWSSAPNGSWQRKELETIADNVAGYIEDNKGAVLQVAGAAIDARTMAECVVHGSLSDDARGRYTAEVEAAILAEAQRLKAEFIPAYEAGWDQYATRSASPEDGGLVVFSDDVDGALKHSIVKELAKRSGLPYAEANDVIRLWAETSNKTLAAHVMQEEAARMFGGKINAWQERFGESYAGQTEAIVESLRLSREPGLYYTAYLSKAAGDLVILQGDLDIARNRLKNLQRTEDVDPGAVEIMAMKVEEIGREARRKKEEIQGLYRQAGLTPERAESLVASVKARYAETARKALRAIYDQTQAYLAPRHPDSYVTLYRGVRDYKILGRGNRNWEKVSGRAMRSIVPRNAMESWTLDAKVAAGFGNIVIAARVPISRVLSTALTGWGAFNEREFVVVGDTNRDEVWAWRS